MKCSSVVFMLAVVKISSVFNDNIMIKISYELSCLTSARFPGNQQELAISKNRNFGLIFKSIQLSHLSVDGKPSG